MSQVPAGGRVTARRPVGWLGGIARTASAAESQSLLSACPPRLAGRCETNGVLSFTTPEIDTAAVITNVLNDEAKSKYIASNNAILRDQAKAFYTGIINAIDPTITVAFEFSQQ